MEYFISISTSAKLSLVSTDPSILNLAAIEGFPKFPPVVMVPLLRIEQAIFRSQRSSSSVSIS